MVAVARKEAEAVTVRSHPHVRKIVPATMAAVMEHSKIPAIVPADSPIKVATVPAANLIMAVTIPVDSPIMAATIPVDSPIMVATILADSTIPVEIIMFPGPLGLRSIMALFIALHTWLILPSVLICPLTVLGPVPFRLPAGVPIMAHQRGQVYLE